MAIGERDPHTGHMTTGHEWNGIKELNTPVPRPVIFFLVATALFAVGYWILMPAWPGVSDYTKGVLGADDRAALAQNVAEAQAARSVWTSRIDALDIDAIRADEMLKRNALDAGRTLFGDNCAVCHGTDGKGSKGFPNLTDETWLWGGSSADIAHTIAAGINAPVEDTRISQMMAYGKDELLPRSDIAAVTSFVQSLSGTAVANETPEHLAQGARIFADNCAVCHGPEGKGGVEFGAPDLTDNDWLYGGDRASILTTLYRGRQGLMPSWRHRLSDTDRKLLVVYVLELGRSQ